MRISILLFLLITTFSYSQERAYIIPIHGNIEPSTLVFVREGIKQAGEDSWIIFDINTFGGRVDSALQITTLIGSLNKRSIAYIPSDPEGLGVSWSAGALISFSCSRIYMARGTSIGAAAPVYIGPEGSRPAEEKTVSAVRTQMASLAEKNGYPVSIALAMVDADIELYHIEKDGIPHLVQSEGKLFLEKGKLLTLTAAQMEYYRVSSGSVDQVSDVTRILGVTDSQVTKINKNLPDKLIFFLTSTTVLGILMTIGLVTLYLEITSPGFGIMGAIGIISFTVVFIGGQLLGTLGSFELLLFLLGLILLIVEIFIIPGFGVTGILGIVSIGTSLILSRQDFIIPKWEWQWEIFNRNILILFIAFISSVVIILILMSLFPRVSIFKRLILSSPTNPGISENSERMIDKGVTVTKLRPIGKIKLGDRVIEARSDGRVIEKERAVIVINREGNRITVKEDYNETDN